MRSGYRRLQVLRLRHQWVRPQPAHHRKRIEPPFLLTLQGHHTDQSPFFAEVTSKVRSHPGRYRRTVNQQPRLRLIPGPFSTTHQVFLCQQSRCQSRQYEVAYQNSSGSIMRISFCLDTSRNISIAWSMCSRLSALMVHFAELRSWIAGIARLIRVTSA